MPDHRSSSWTYFYKYIFVPLWAGGFLVGVFAAWSTGDEFGRKWALSSSLMVGYALLWLIPVMRRLKFVEAFEDRLVVKGLGQEADVPYKDVEWMYEIALINPTIISVKFKNRPHIPFEKILIIPAVKFSFNPLRGFLLIFRETEMTRYLREQIKEANHVYSRENEPSRWLPVALLFLTALPLVYLLNQFMP